MPNRVSRHDTGVTQPIHDLEITTPPAPQEDHRLVVAARATVVGDISALDGCAQLCDDFDRSGLSTSAVLDGLPTSVRSPIGLISKRIVDLTARTVSSTGGNALTVEVGELAGIEPGPALSGFIAELRTVFPNLETPLDKPIRTYIDQHRNDRNAA